MTEGDARVSYRKDDGKWAVDVEGAAWAASRHDNRERAERAGRTLAQEQGSNLTVKGKDGEIERTERGVQAGPSPHLRLRPRVRVLLPNPVQVDPPRHNPAGVMADPTPALSPNERLLTFSRPALLAELFARCDQASAPLNAGLSARAFVDYAAFSSPFSSMSRSRSLACSATEPAAASPDSGLLSGVSLPSGFGVRSSMFDPPMLTRL